MKIKGIKAVCSDSQLLKNRNDGCYLQLNYDPKKNEVFADFLCSLGHNDWKEYDDSNIILIGFIDAPMAKKDIEALIIRKLETSKSDTK